MKINYILKVPVVNFEDVEITTKDLIFLLEQELKSLCGRWDTVIECEGEWVYYSRGYGSHDIGEEYGKKVDGKNLDNILNINKVLDYLRSKVYSS